MSLFSNLYTDPFSDLLDMQRRMDRMLGRWGTPGFESDVPLITGRPSDLTVTAGGGTTGQLATWNPRIDVRETDNSLVVHAELPGCKKEDIKLSIDHDNNRLVLQGEKHTKKRAEGENWVRRERFEGSFYRALPIPRGCDVNNINANFSNGVLEISVPKAGEVGKLKYIDIKTSEKTETGKAGEKVPIGGEEPRPQTQAAST